MAFLPNTEKSKLLLKEFRDENIYINIAYGVISIGLVLFSGWQQSTTILSIIFVGTISISIVNLLYLKKTVSYMDVLNEELCASIINIFGKAFKGRILTDKKENAALVKQLLKSAYNDGCRVYEISTSENGDDYEKEWDKINDELVLNKEKRENLFRFYDKRFVPAESHKELPSGIQVKSGIDWPVDLLLVVNSDNKPREAILGVFADSKQDSKWIAVHTHDNEFLSVLYDRALSLRDKK
jgi:hypothetical protein